MARAKKRTRKPARKAARKPARKAARKPARKATKKRVSSKKALESKIAALERKLSNISKPPPKPQTAPPPPPKPAPKPAEKAPPVYEQWKSVGTKNWNDQKPIVTGYTANSDRYWASLHVQNAPDVPAKNWNDQKAVVTGYTQPGDKYFATRQRLAYHPRDKTFQPEIAASVSGSASTQTAPPPPPPPPPQPESKPQASSGKKSRQQELEEFEKGYLEREEVRMRESEEAAVEEVAEVASKKGALPKGF